ncbi:MAG TPA: hypothetical protein VFS43_29475 [Polyangiaceae bacterium]|nr:hypothetical protein [Polyangiaceae bacterium]
MQENDDLLKRLSAAVYRHLATDDMTGGEGTWAFRIDLGTRRVALPPEGTRIETMQRLSAAVAADPSVGGGHLMSVPVDPANPGGPKRLALVADGDYVPPQGDAPAPAALSEGTGEGERYPAPAGPAGPGSPPPPAQGEPGEG